MSSDITIIDAKAHAIPREVHRAWQACLLREALKVTDAELRDPGTPHVVVQYYIGSHRCVMVRQLIRPEGASLALLWSGETGLYFLVVLDEESLDAVRTVSFVAETHTAGPDTHDRVFDKLRKKADA